MVRACLIGAPHVLVCLKNKSVSRSYTTDKHITLTPDQFHHATAPLHLLPLLSDLLDMSCPHVLPANLSGENLVLHCLMPLHNLHALHNPSDLSTIAANMTQQLWLPAAHAVRLRQWQQWQLGQTP